MGKFSLMVLPYAMDVDPTTWLRSGKYWIGR